MGTEHTLLQKIASHTRVHLGNFSEEQQLDLQRLIDTSEVIVVNEWCSLSSEGRERLYSLNGSHLETS
ncbi:MAG: hypothetical protein EBZ49_16835 [Proteobacteria bacterium]|nr:hypothetical protein [Pseudomonadota bacterium]